MVIYGSPSPSLVDRDSAHTIFPPRKSLKHLRIFIAPHRVTESVHDLPVSVKKSEVIYESPSPSLVDRGSAHTVSTSSLKEARTPSLYPLEKLSLVLLHLLEAMLLVPFYPLEIICPVSIHLPEIVSLVPRISVTPPGTTGIRLTPHDLHVFPKRSEEIHESRSPGQGLLGLGFYGHSGSQRDRMIYGSQPPDQGRKRLRSDLRPPTVSPWKQSQKEQGGPPSLPHQSHW